MAGLRLRLLPKRAFDFGKLTVGSTQTFVLAERVDVSQYVDLMVALRVHALDLTGGTISFRVFGDGFSQDDPSLSFRTASELFTGASLSAAGILHTFGGAASGAFAALVVTANRTSAAALSATVSMDWVLRCPDEN